MARSPMVFVLPEPAGPGDVRGACERMAVLLESGEVDLVLCDVAALGGADAIAIEALARLHLTAKRLGCRMRLCHASAELRQLLTFAGLGEVLRVEPGRKPEEREQPLRVEEEGELDDPVA
ncbi:MAG: STAS domain-containing protein [Gaiellaceae bacterium]